MQSERLGAFRRGLHSVIRVANWVAGLALAAILVVLVANTFGRYMFHKPLQGTLEIVAVCLMVVAFFSMARTELDKAHINVSVVTDRFPRRLSSLVRMVVYLISFLYLAVLTWRSGLLGLSTISPRIEQTYLLDIPLFPFMFIMAFGVLLFGLEMLFDCFRPIPPPERGKKDEGS